MGLECIGLNLINRLQIVDFIKNLKLFLPIFLPQYKLQLYLFIYF